MSEPKFSKLVQGKAESLIRHLRAYGEIGLSRAEWECLRTFASFLFREVEEGAAADKQAEIVAYLRRQPEWSDAETFASNIERGEHHAALSPTKEQGDG